MADKISIWLMSP